MTAEQEVIICHLPLVIGFGDIPEDWQWHSIGELDIRRKYGVNILGVKRNGKTDVNISPETILDGSLTLLVLGENKALKKQFHL